MNLAAYDLSQREYMKEYSNYTIVTVNFAKEPVLVEMDNLDPILGKIVQTYI